ncbi:MAG: protein kinase [Methylococcales bacterium]|jgi:serine/threonine-protein kinase PpkA|nr:protein kinase [Methylococcales bacterium]
MKISDYTIEKEIGNGSISTVYLAVRESTGDQVALKVFSPELSTQSDFKNEFLGQATELISLNNPNVIKVFDAGECEGHYYIAMEYFPAGTLKHKMLVGLSGGKSIKLVEQMANALAYLHGEGLAHLSVKPSNIFLREDGSAVLSEVEVARVVEEQSVSFSLESFDNLDHYYTSPEHINGKKTDNRSDFYTLGVLLFELVSGHAPFRSKDLNAILKMHVNDPVPEVMGRFSYVQPVVNQLLAKKPQNRICNIRQFNDVLKEVQAAHDAEHAVVDEVDDEEESSGSSMKWVVIGGIVVAAAAGVFLSGGKEDVPKKNNEETQSTQQTQTVFEESLSQEEIEVIDESENEVVSLLEIAEKQIEAGFLLEPANDNAYETYQIVLEKDPENERAKLGLIKVADYYKRRVRKSYETGSLQRTLVLIKVGIEKFPTNEGLLKLQSYVDRRLNDDKQLEEDGKKVKKEVDKLLRIAKRQIKSKRLTTPPGDNAYETFQDIALLAPTETWAKEGYQRIANMYAENAETAFSNGDLKKTGKLVEQGLAVVSNNPRLLDVQGKLNKLIASMQKQKEEQELKIRLLLEKAKEQMAVSKLISPEGDNAYGTYQTILSVEKDEVRALNGIKEIGDRYYRSAKQKQNQRNLQDALTTVNDALSVIRNHRDLITLQRQIQTQISDKEKYKRQQVALKKRVERLLKTANNQVSKARLRDAYLSYKKLKRMAPSDQRINRLLPKITDKYVVIARNQQRRGKLNNALSTIQQGLAVSPDNNQLLTLRSQINSQIVTIKRQEKARRQAEFKQQELARQREAQRKKIEAKKEAQRQATIRRKQELEREAEAQRKAEAEKIKPKEEIEVFGTF